MPNPLRKLLCRIVALAALGTLAAPLAAQQFVQEVAPLPAVRQMHGSAVLNGFLYVIGGAKEDAANDQTVIKAPINPDGSLGAWSQTTPLPQPRLYIGSSTMALNDKLYVLGGSAGVLKFECYNTVLYTAPDAQGNLYPWQQSMAYPASGVNAPAAVAALGFIHLIGGLNSGGSAIPQVYSLRLDDLGKPVEWIQGPPLPTPLWYHNAAVSGGRVFVWGGLVKSGNTDGTTACVSAPVLGTGQLGDWRKEPVDLPEPFYAASVAVAGPYLISFSPRLPGSIEKNDIYWTSCGQDGLSPWKKLPTMIQSRIYHASAQDYRNGFVYLSGGRVSKLDEHSYVKNVYTFRLSPAARDQAYAAHQASTKLAPQPTANSVSLQGTPDNSAPTPEVAQAAKADATLKLFRPYETVRSVGRPMVVYFHVARAKPCREQMENLDNTVVASVASKYGLAMVDPTKQPQIAQNLGVWRAPTWVFFDEKGYEKGRQVGLLTTEQLKSHAP